MEVFCDSGVDDQASIVVHVAHGLVADQSLGR